MAASAALLMGVVSARSQRQPGSGTVEVSSEHLFAVPDPPPGVTDGPGALASPPTHSRAAAHTKLFDPRDAKKYTFFPQAGQLGRDLFINNFTDLDASTPGARDWDCSGYTYDGHRGHDIEIRSFREQDIGVPVFAVLDGRVTYASDGNPDTNISCTGSGNGVLLDHGNGHGTLYWHLRRGSVAVRLGDEVKAGQELGLTASSGCSTWPHLHFESRQAGNWYEPSAGRCRQGTSQWQNQPPVHRSLLLSGFYLTDQPIPCCDHFALARDLDPMLRTAVMRLNASGLSSRVDLHNLPGGSNWRWRVRRPNGSLADDRPGSFGNNSLWRHAIWIFNPATRWNEVGTWRFQLIINNSLVVDAPFEVVAGDAEPLNRPPKAIRLALSPNKPKAGQVVACLVDAPLVGADPDYDLVRFRYEWRANGRLLRSVTSAAMSDVLRRDLVQRGVTLLCKVTPNDGRSDGPTATVRRKVGA